jgi:hypothetical protein
LYDFASPTIEEAIMKLEITRYFNSEEYNFHCFFQPPQASVYRVEEVDNVLVSAPNPLDRYRVPTLRLLPF